ncbi:MAG: sulfite exporter TauE/SafE family protein [Rhodobacteraceae bacterium]|nr:MAG: sulfite exporter TauE/SafE family protein [Paracoccaceae bacterium]
MDAILALPGPQDLALAFAVAALAGVIKGLVGFAMPMVLISGLSLILPPEIALAGLILPTLVTNAMQALAQGWRAAAWSIRQFRVFLIVGGLVLVSSAQLVGVVPQPVLLLGIGLPVTLFAVLLLAGVRFRVSRQSPRVDAGVAAVAGFIGGFSGIWGPPTVAYLTALDTPKADALRVQGVIYGLGAVALAGAHLGSGVLNAQTAPFSASLVLPAILGMWIGGWMQRWVDQALFRRLTLIVLVVAGLNLVRRGLMGM